MRLTIRLDRDRLKHSHLRLVQRLAHRPLTRMAVQWRPGTASLPRAAALTAAIETLIYRLPVRSPFAPATPADFASFVPDEGGAGDVVLDLTDGAARPGEPTWQLRFDGRRGR